MSGINQSFQDTFEKILKKVSAFTRMQIEILLVVMTWLAEGRPFNARKIATRSGGKFNRKDIAETLKCYGRYQRLILRVLLLVTLKGLRRNKRIKLSVDDHLVGKKGKKIYGVGFWYDHGTGSSGRAFCIVDVALVVDGKAILVIPWLVRNRRMAALRTTKKSKKKKQQQDIKTGAALQLLNWLIPSIVAAGWRLDRIQVLMDAWYSSRRVLDRMRKRGWNFRINGKKSYRVQEPDWDRIKTRGKPKRGPPYKRFVKYVPLEQFMGTPSSWKCFTCPFTGKIVNYRVAVITLKTGGRVTLYAYFREGCKNPRYILTNASYKSKTGHVLVYVDYYHRWPVEEAHRDLKQQFGLGTAQHREKEVVKGFISFVYAGYSLFCKARYKHRELTGEWITTPAFQEGIKDTSNYHPPDPAVLTATA